MIKSPIVYLTGVLLILTISACQQTAPTKDKGLFDFLTGGAEPTPTDRACFANASTQQRTKSSVFLLAAGANTGKLTETTTDIENFRQIVQRHFNIPENQICRLPNVFKAELENAFGSLKQRLISDDLVIIYFSGHGSYLADESGDEKDGWDEALVPYNVKGKNHPRASDVLRDDDFAALVNALPTDKILTVMDTCFSSGMYLKKNQSNSVLTNARSKFFLKGEIGTQAPNYPLLANAQSQFFVKGKTGSRVLRSQTPIPNQVGYFEALEGLLLAAASENETALEIEEGGLFTLNLVQQFKKHGDIKQAFTQAARQVRKETQNNRSPQTPQAIGKWEVVD